MQILDAPKFWRTLYILNMPSEWEKLVTSTINSDLLYSQLQYNVQYIWNFCSCWWDSEVWLLCLMYKQNTTLKFPRSKMTTVGSMKVRVCVCERDVWVVCGAILTGLPKSLHLDPIEHLWDYSKQQVKNHRLGLIHTRVAEEWTKTDRNLNISGHTCITLQ